MITDKLAEMEDEEEVPKIKLGDASCAAPDYTCAALPSWALVNSIGSNTTDNITTFDSTTLLKKACLHGMGRTSA